VSKRTKFLTGLLGADGAEALKKATDYNQNLAKSIVARSITGWLAVASRNDYKGKLPGNDYSCTLKKTEQGFSGKIYNSQETVVFENATLNNVAGAIAIALGIDTEVPEKIDKISIQALGKSIDLLIKARFVADHRPQKVAPPSKKTIPSLPRIVQRSYRLSKSALEAECKVCSEPFFVKEKFVSCHCFKGLGSINLLVKNEVPILTFNRSWDQEAITTLLEALNG
jgi:hypothetical protein